MPTLPSNPISSLPALRSGRASKAWRSLALGSVFILGCGPKIPEAVPVVVSPAALTAVALEDPMMGPQEESPVGLEAEGEVEADGGAVRGEEIVAVAGEDGIDEDMEFVFDDLPVGDPYPVEGLVGQINGRPVFADEFLLPLEDRILRIVAERPLAQAVRDVDRLVVLRFDEYINSELIIAEAESMLSAEQQQGVLAWLTSVQEQTITDRGGTRDSAANSIEDEFGISLDEFIAQRRSVALAQDLLRKRVQPRAIVSWRDVEQAYRRNYAAYNPPATILIGRLRFHRERQAEEVEEASRLFAEGLDFPEVCESLGVTDGGEWLEIELPTDGIEGTSLASAVKSRLDLGSPGSVTESLEQGVFVSWFSVIGVNKQPGRSLFDPVVQLSLEGELAGLRYAQEQDRYLSSLKDRWVAGDIEQMRKRLLLIARVRYLTNR
ncbi:MAG: hypothetical protein CMJ22_09740 [Phycisphaerae bacterium]|nr:hypothetical protein [Phycisphaerae bacterium]MAC75842.1 hypothetical protein [Phycisphaerae bacterium]